MAAPSLAAIAAVAKPIPDVPPSTTILFPCKVMGYSVCVSIEVPFLLPFSCIRQLLHVKWSTLFGPCLVLEVVTLVEIRDEPGLHGIPAEPLAGQCARRRVVD